MLARVPFGAEEASADIPVADTGNLAQLICSCHTQHMSTHSSGPTITSILVADFGVEGGDGGRMPVYIHLIELAGQTILVDTGIKQLHPAVSDMDPKLYPWTEEFDFDSIDHVINTHLHFDHCGGNYLFTQCPVHVQARELDDARNIKDYTFKDWVDAEGVHYVTHDGEAEIIPGIRVVPAPGHTQGSQVVVIETDDRPIIIAGDTAVWFGELDEPKTEGQLLIHALGPAMVWLSHEHKPWSP